MKAERIYSKAVDKSAAERRDEFSPAFQGRGSRRLTGGRVASATPEPPRAFHASLTRRIGSPLDSHPALKGRAKLRRRSAADLSTAFAYLATALALVLSLAVLVVAQTATDVPADDRRPRADEGTVALYFDPVGGVTADEAVARALDANGELLALRKEVEAARALVRQASFRANPRLDVSGAKAVTTSDHQLMVEGMLPLELGGRRAARVRVAGREVEVREALLAERERIVAAEVRARFGEALAEILKLGVTEDLLGNSQRGYRLVVARVLEGRTAPLEQNQVLVEVNRLRSMREAGRGKVEVALLELRNLMGANPSEPLKLRGDFDGLIDPLPALADATARALDTRADLRAARASEALAESRIGEARAAGRADADVRAGYQRMRSGLRAQRCGRARAPRAD